ncbi:MAG: PAS domain S-box protein [Chitinophagaceae bacterium]
MALIPSDDFQCLFETAPGLYLVLLPDFTIATASNAYLIATMTERESITGRSLFEVFPDNPADKDADGVLHLKASLNYVLQHRKPHAMAVQKHDIRRPDGVFEVRYWSPVNSPVFNAQKELIYITHYVADVTERILAETQLREFEHFFNNSNDLSCIANKDGYFEVINPGLKNALGYFDNELSENPFLDFIHPDDIAATIREYDKLKAGALVIHFLNRYRKKDGSYLWFDWNATPNPGSGKLYCIARDITLRKKLEDELKRSNEALEQRVLERTAEIQKSENKYRYLFQNNPLPMWVIDAVNFTFLDVNEVAILHYGYTREEFLAMTALDIRPGEDKQAFLQTDHSVEPNPDYVNRGVWNHQKKDGSVIQVEINAHQIIFENSLAKLILANDVTAKIKAEQALASSEMRFRLLIENSAEGISMTDEASNNIYRSPAAQKMMGPITGSATINRTHPDYTETLKSIHLQVLHNPGIPVAFQGRFLHAAGYYIWLEGTFTNLLHVKGVNAIVANYRDITQRKELEDLLHKANVLARIGGWEVDLVKETVYWTAITREIHETADDYIPALDTGLYFYKEGKGRELIIQKVKEAIELGRAWDEELQIITAKNNERWIRTIGETEFINGKCVRIYGSFQDIDQRKKAEEKLVKSEGLYRSLFTNMLNGFCYCQVIFENGLPVDYRYIAVNNEYELLTGLHNITGKKMSEVIPGLLEADPQFANVIKLVAGDGLTQQFETYIEPLKKWFSISVYSPEKGYFVSLMDNITERKEAEQKITKLNAELEERVVTRTAQLKKTNEELEAFSYSVSHDLRAPLRAIIGFAAILEEDYGSKLDEEAKRIITIVKKNTLKMGHLIDDLLTFSRTGRQDMVKTVIDSNLLVNDIIDSIKINGNHKNIQWLVQPLPAVEGDPNTIRQVWLNLISNAVKYSGKVTEPQIEIGALVANGQTEFFVQDNGAGFDEHYKDKLFKVFQRLHGADEFEGTGIGLAIVEKVISKHGGSVWAASAVSKGARFSFSLPA